MEDQTPFPVNSNPVRFVSKYKASHPNWKCATCGKAWKKKKTFPYIKESLLGLPWNLMFYTVIGTFLAIANVILFTIISLKENIFSSIGVSCYMNGMIFFTWIWWMTFLAYAHLITERIAFYMHMLIMSMYVFSFVGIIIMIVAKISNVTYITFTPIITIFAYESMIVVVAFYLNASREVVAMNKIDAAKNKDI